MAVPEFGLLPLPGGAEGGLQFERLLAQLLLDDARVGNYLFLPTTGSGGDGGFDGIAPKGAPGLKGRVGYQFKWLAAARLQQAQGRDQVADSVAHMLLSEAPPDHIVLYASEDLTDAAQRALWDEVWNRVPKIHGRLGRHPANPAHKPPCLYRGHTEIVNLLRQSPDLMAYLYPQRIPELSLTRTAGFAIGNAAEFVARYRDLIGRQHGRIYTIGLPPEVTRAQAANQIVQLPDIFVPPHFRTGSSDARAELAELVRSSGGRVILGQPGSGKSTLLAYLALWAAGKVHIEGCTPPEDCLPIHIPLRDYLAQGGTGQRLGLVEFAAAQARERGVAETHPLFLEGALRLGRAILLVDGLDEAGDDTTRANTARTLETLQDHYRDCLFFVTSRIHGYSANIRLDDRHFVHHTLRELDAEQVRRFIENWSALRYPEDQGKRERYLGSLLGALDANEQVRSLRGNPLLLTIMAFVHFSRGTLPRDRGELYRQCVNLLLDTWVEVKRPSDARTPGASRETLSWDLSVAAQESYLAGLALQVQSRNENLQEAASRAAFPRAFAEGELQERHFQSRSRRDPDFLKGDARRAMREFLEYLCDRSGILYDRGDDQLSFIHLSFQEFLAATEGTAQN